MRRLGADLERACELLEHGLAGLERPGPAGVAVDPGESVVR